MTVNAAVGLALFMPKSHDNPIRTVEHIVYFSIGGISMCKTSFKVTVFYDGTRTAKEALNDAIAAKVRRKMLDKRNIKKSKFLL